MITLLEEPKTDKKFKFRLLASNYQEGRGDKRKTYQVERDPVTKKWLHPIIETDTELDKLFNAPGFPPKFERINSIETAVIADPLQRMPGETVQDYLSRLGDLTRAIKQQSEDRMKEVDKMDKEQLEDFAEAEEIDLKGAKTVEAMRVAVKNALKVQ